MRFAEIPAAVLSVRVKLADAGGGRLAEQTVFSVAPRSVGQGEFEIRLKDSVVFVKPAKETDIRRLNMELADGRAMIAQLSAPAADESVDLQIAFFSGECLEMGDVEIGADEYVEETYAKIAHKTVSGERLYRALAEQCCYTHGEESFFFLFAGPAIDSMLREDQQDVDIDVLEEPGEASEQEETGGETVDAVPEDSGPHITLSRQKSLCIVGSGMRLVATEAKRPDGHSVFIARRMRESKSGPDRALRLARGRLTFLDWTRAGQIQSLAKAQMSALTMDDGSYLKRWDEFVDIEGELLLKQARGVGVLHYSDMTSCRDNYITVHITQASDFAFKALEEKGVQSVEVADDLPRYLKNLEMTFTEFTGFIGQEAEQEGSSGKRRNRQTEMKPHLNVTEYDAATKSLTIETENLPASGMLILSLAGQIAQIKRRLSARKAIVEGRAANPQLGLLIEERGVIAPTRASSIVKPLTAFVCDKVFRNPPTERQRDAIEVALNTPDIALIQGPPGTGKTTVIAAIIERLNEMADKRGVSIKGSVLLTGLQHDAVENMIERLTLNGLPVPKFGKRVGANEDGFAAFERDLDKWCADRAAMLRSKNPQLVEIEQETQIRNLCLQYLRAPSRTLALILAKRIANLGILILGEQCSRRAAHLVKRLCQEEQLNARTDPLLDRVRRLRHLPESFSDDGPERATDVLDDLHDVLEEDERDLLNKAGLWRNEEGTPLFLNDIAALKKKLLIRFASPPTFRVEKQSDEVVTLVEEVRKRIRSSGISIRDAKSAALAEFLAELESNPHGMMDAVSDYAYAFAATCQQSVNSDMQKQKGMDKADGAKNTSTLGYEYVIVDEAARVSPPDLMVAMAQGKRIILVGDHRQLPHIIDDAVAKQMEDAETGKQEAEWLKKSMFQYLFSERLGMLEQMDSIPRRVTLDKQYRMHPLLGDFVSRSFYERFDPSEKFGSGRPVSDFAHNLADTGGRPAVWLEVPASKGIYSRKGTSWIRPAEVTAIAHRLQVWMNSKEGQDLSFGVISFYKGQADLIRKTIGARTYDKRKLRIDTVDSFQGMEFDVVILSMVRTMRHDRRQPSADDEIQARRVFGHLCLYNRLNVSMSRQKKLLVVAGDSGLVQSDLAAKYVPGLVDFYHLCRTEGRVIACQ